jgi:transcription antitermination factor NusG
MPITIHKYSDLRSGCYAFNVRARGEESIARTLRDKGYEVLLPSYIQKRQYSDRTRRVTCALFPGYVFAYATMGSMMGILETPGTKYVLRTGAMISPLSPEDEQSVRALCLVEGECEPCWGLQVGLRVQIEAGPLAGLTGILTNVRNRDRVIISIESVQRSVMVEVGNTNIRVIGEQSRQLAG